MLNLVIILQKMKKLNTRKELRSVLSRAKFFTFDQEGKCSTMINGKKVCQKIELSEKLRERVHDQLGKYFEGPKYLYIFPDVTNTQIFVKRNILKYEDNIQVVDSYNMAYTIILAIAMADILLTNDYQLMRVYQHNPEESLPNLKTWRDLNKIAKDISLAINQFKYKSISA